MDAWLLRWWLSLDLELGRIRTSCIYELPPSRALVSCPSPGPIMYMDRQEHH